MFKYKFNKLLIISLIAILALGLFGCKKNTEGLVAMVNGEPITEDEFNTDYGVFKSLYEKQLGDDALEQVGQDGKTLGQSLKESILEKLIMEKLIAKDSSSMNISITEEEIDAQMEEYISAMGGQENFDKFLADNDITKEFFQSNMKKELLVDKHKIEFFNGITVSEDESKAYFEANKEDLVVIKASHILVATEEEGKKVLERLKNGEDFAQVATLESLESGSAAQGGELGYLSKGNMIAEFEDAAFDLEEGEISDLVKTEVGYHIIYLQDRKDTYEELENDIILDLKEKEYLESIKVLRNKAKIERYLDMDDK